MRKIKILLIFIVFVGIIFCFNNTIYAFSKGDTVRCKVRSYIYILDANTKQIIRAPEGYKIPNGPKKGSLGKGTIVTYVKKGTGIYGREGLCRVKFDNCEVWIKEVNLEKYNMINEGSNETAQKIYDKYEDTDFSKVAPYELKSISDALIQAKKTTTDTLLQGRLDQLIKEIAEVAKGHGMDVKDDGTIGEASTSSEWQDTYDDIQNAGGWEGYSNETEIYTSQPKRTGKSNEKDGAGESIDDLINDADDFVTAGDSEKIKQSSLQDFSNMMYNILLTIGIVVAVIVGAIIGVKLMSSGIDTKVEAKRLLIPYVFGCLAVFGAFGIWKIVVTILQGI